MTESGETHVRRIALGAMMALACAASLMLVNEVHVGPAWVHWTISVVALAAALGVLIVADLSWERAVAAAEADGLVVGPDAPAGGVSNPAQGTSEI
ncbi:MAG: hypothetical protein JOZ49_01245 [Mycolicibacterium sp.]|nr:hypothetical protein [Mycolicibacterium sp.]